MTLDHFVSVFSALLSFIGLLLVVVQFRNANRQREAESLIKIYDINRELLSLGFDHPQLFPILEDKPGSDPVWERRYLQLWLNQLSLIHLYVKHSVIKDELRESLERSVSGFMTLKNLRERWQSDRTAYPESFQKLVDGIIDKSEPPTAAASSGSDGQDSPSNLLKRCAWNSHEGLPGWRGQHRGLGGNQSESLNEQVPVVGQNCRGASALVAQGCELPIFSDYFLNPHFDDLVRFLASLKQNHAFCFTHVLRGALV